MKRLIGIYTGLPKSMYFICLATVINRFGDFVVPFLALYLTQKIGMRAVTSGFIVTLASLIGIPASMIGGQVSDILGRKKVYIIAQFISAVFLMPCALTRNAVISVSFLLLSTFFNGFLRPAFSSIIADILPAERRQAGFSLNYLAINVGVSVGPVVAGFLFNNLLPMLFIGDAITSFAAVFLIWKYVEEPDAFLHKKSTKNKAEKAESGNILQMLYKRPHICLFIIIKSVYSFVYSQHKFALPITLNAVFRNDGARIFGYVMSVNAVTVLVLTVFIGALTRKNHALFNMVLSGIMYAVGFGMIGYVDSFSLIILSTIIWTIGEILSSTNAGVYVANNSPSNYRARLNAIYSIGGAIGSAASTSFSGAYIQSYGCKSIWGLTLIISLIAVVCMFALKIFTKKVGSDFRRL